MIDKLSFAAYALDDAEGGREKVGNPTAQLSATTAGLPHVEDELPCKRQARFF
jgi:hypothetical protein